MFFNKTEVAAKQQPLEEDSAVLRSNLESMKGTKASEKSVKLYIWNSIPFFNQFVESATGSGNAMTNLVRVKGLINNATETASNAFQWIKLGTAIIDFVRIPLIYIGAAATKQEIPFTFSRNARLLYASVVLGLTITAIAFPPAAPIIALVAAIGALGQSIVTLANLFHKRSETQDKLAQVEKDIAAKKAQISSLIDELEELEKKTKGCSEDEINTKREEIKKQLNVLQELYNTQEDCKQKLEKLGTTAAMDKTAGLAFASLGLVGAAVSLVFPPAGLGILAATASLAVVYLVARVTYPFLKSLAEKIINTVRKQIGSEPGHHDERIKEALRESVDKNSNMDLSAGQKSTPEDVNNEASRLKQLVRFEPKIHSSEPGTGTQLSRDEDMLKTSHNVHPQQKDDKIEDTIQQEPKMLITR